MLKTFANSFTVTQVQAKLMANPRIAKHYADDVNGQLLREHITAWVVGSDMSVNDIVAIFVMIDSSR